MQKWTPLLQYFPLLTFLTFLSANCSIKNSPALDSAQAAGLQLVSNKKALRHICTELASFNGTGVNAGEIIQVCINNTPPGGILELPAGIYTLTQQITFNRALTLQTEGKEGAPICDHELGLDCATFVAAPNFNIRFGLMLVSHPDVTLDHIVLDGNRQARLATPTGSSIAKNCLSDNTFGFNARAEAPGFSFLSSVSKGALCGTALGVANGENLKIL
ncbi:MAG: hypothetical protein ACXWC9_02310, partial [Pseudobdellovibrionaceae bacterium]